MDPFLTGRAGNLMRQQGQSYLQRGQAFMQVGSGWAAGGEARWHHGAAFIAPTLCLTACLQSKMGFLSGSTLHYHFTINPEYGE